MVVGMFIFVNVTVFIDISGENPSLFAVPIYGGVWFRVMCEVF